MCKTLIFPYTLGLLLEKYIANGNGRTLQERHVHNQNQTIYSVAHSLSVRVTAVLIALTEREQLLPSDHKTTISPSEEK